MKDREQAEETTDDKMIELFNQTSSVQEKLQYFSKIRDYNRQMELLDKIPNSEKYKFIGKIKSAQGIAVALNSLEDDKAKSKTFNFIAKQLKGNNEGLLRILTQIDFNVTIPPNMLIFQLNNLNALNLDFLINIQKHVNNHSEMKFTINEEDDSRDIKYSFAEISAIVAKIEELTADIPRDMDEANRFFTIYSRLTKMTTYDHQCIYRSDDAKDRLFHRSGYAHKKNYGIEQYKAHMHEIRKKAAGLYGGLVEGKAICAGYALILHEALLYTGIKSQYVGGYNLETGKGHAWNQVQIYGKWYNCDPTWDSQNIQRGSIYQYMLLEDKKFEQSHGKFPQGRKKTYHQCKSSFDYTKIKAFSPMREGIGKG